MHTDSKLHYAVSRVSGLANIALSASKALQLAQAIGIIFRTDKGKPRIIIGKDTRGPNYMIENALVAGFTSVGKFVMLLGPLPSQGVAQLVKSMRCELGVMISAPGEAHETSGITFFDAEGTLLSSEKWAAVLNVLEGDLASKLASPAKIGKAWRVEEARARYITIVKSTMPKLDLSELRIVLDCAHGAAYNVAPTVLRELGAEVICVGCEPTGININRDVGISPSPGKGHEYVAQEQIKTYRADAGIVFDSDGAHVLVLDKQGGVFFDSRISRRFGTANPLLPVDGLAVTLKALSVMQSRGLRRK